jgi:hypothetical protein
MWIGRGYFWVKISIDDSTILSDPAGQQRIIEDSRVILIYGQP